MHRLGLASIERDRYRFMTEQWFQICVWFKILWFLSTHGQLNARTVRVQSGEVHVFPAGGAHVADS